MDIEIGLSSASFYPLVDTENSISLMKNTGFNIGEIFLNSFSEYEDEFLSNLVQEKYRHNFSIDSVHAFSSSFEPYIFDDYKRRRKDMMAVFDKVCKAANKLGAKLYTFHGMRHRDFNSLNKKLVLDIYDELVYKALENGILLCQENVCWCMSKDIEFLCFLKENLKYPISFTLDLKQAYKADIEPLKYLKIMGEDIKNLHINDKDNYNVCLLPGRGDIDYKEIFDELKKVNYKGNAIIEVYRDNYDNYDEITNSKKYINNILMVL